MPLTQTTPKTYSNPSWTMAIASQPSALSKWWGQTLEGISSFTLEFKPKITDDSEPENPQSNLDAVVVQGDQAQLESLAQLTERHIQSLLVRSPAAIPTETGSQPTLTTMSEEDGAFPEDAPEWQAHNDYSHSLYLGSLQVEPITREVKVSTTQLYDLSEILQTSLATVQPQADAIRQLPVRSPSWPKTAAVAAVAMGLTGGLAWFIVGSPSIQTASTPEDDLVSLETPPQLGDQDLNPGNLPPTSQGLPKSPNSPVGKPSQGKPQSTQPSVPNSLTKPDDVIIAAQKLKEQRQKTASSTQTPQTQTPPKKSGQTSPVLTGTAANDNSPNATQPPPTAATQRADAIREAETQKIAQELAASPFEEPSVEARIQSGVSTTAKTTAPDSAEVGEAPSPTPSPVQSPPPTQLNQGAGSPEPSSPSVSEQPVAAASDFSRLAANASAPSSTSIRTFFESQWKGQSSLEQSLSYTIEVQPDGIVSAITPNDPISSAQIGQTPIPPEGGTMTAPFAGETTVTYQVKFDPDGSVSVE